jgi:hypothetical protein
MWEPIYFARHQDPRIGQGFSEVVVVLYPSIPEFFAFVRSDLDLAVLNQIKTVVLLDILM